MGSQRKSTSGKKVWKIVLTSNMSLIYLVTLRQQMKKKMGKERAAEVHKELLIPATELDMTIQKLVNQIVEKELERSD